MQISPDTYQQVKSLNILYPLDAGKKRQRGKEEERKQKGKQRKSKTDEDSIDTADFITSSSLDRFVVLPYIARPAADPGRGHAISW